MDPSLQQQILSMQMPYAPSHFDHGERLAYKQGHELARHVAAELVLPLEARCEALAEMLSVCQEVFTRYAALHWAKETQCGNTKAEANMILANRCLAVLNESPTPPTT